MRPTAANEDDESVLKPAELVLTNAALAEDANMADAEAVKKREIRNIARNPMTQTNADGIHQKRDGQLRRTSARPCDMVCRGANCAFSKARQTALNAYSQGFHCMA